MVSTRTATPHATPSPALVPGSGMSGVMAVQLTEQEIARRTKQARSGRPWLRLQTKVFAEETHCWICHRYVDQSLPGTTHPMARTVDHVHPLWLGGDPLDRSNCRLAHRRCNTARNNRLRAAQRPRPSHTVDAAAL